MDANKTWIALDIETVPARDEIPKDSPLYPKFKPRNGATKAETVEKQRQEWEESDPLASAGLDPMRGAVATVGLFEALDKSTLCHHHNEGHGLRILWAFLLGPPNDPWQYPRPIVTYNGRKFDIPFLLTRSLLLSAITPQQAYQVRKWYLGAPWRTEETHIDLMEHFSGGLDFVAHRFLGEGKLVGDISGENMEQAVNEGRWEEIERYCLHDCYLAYSIAQRALLIP